MKILNLYSGIGGNRKLWGNNHTITAVELNEEIAAVYKDYFPNDKLIIGDAHNFLLKNYKRFDFIWDSTPCPSHSNARFWSSKGGMYDEVYPDMALYQEILFLKHFFSGKWVVENVKPYYEPLIKPSQEIGRHLFWSNFKVPNIETTSNYIFSGEDKKRVTEMLGFNLDKYKIEDKTKVLRNCVAPEIGKAILESALNIYNDNKASQIGLFKVGGK